MKDNRLAKIIYKKRLDANRLRVDAIRKGMEIDSITERLDILMSQKTNSEESREEISSQIIKSKDKLRNLRSEIIELEERAGEIEAEIEFRIFTRGNHESLLEDQE